MWDFYLRQNIAVVEMSVRLKIADFSAIFMLALEDRKALVTLPINKHELLGIPWGAIK